MGLFSSIVKVLGRVSIALPFIFFGINMITDWSQAEQDLVDMLSKMHDGPHSYMFVEQFFGALLSWPSLVLIISIILELGGAIMIFFGVKLRLAAVMLLIFLIPTTLMSYPFWMGGEKEVMSMSGPILRNLGIIGGLLLILGYESKGSGSASSFNLINKD